MPKTKMKKTLTSIISFLLILCPYNLWAEMVEPLPQFDVEKMREGVKAYQTDLFTGAAIYNIPIEAVPGTNNMQPKLELSYNSNSGNGWSGYGWSLDVGKISRSTKLGTPTYTNSDTFELELNGTKSDLVLPGDGYYHTEIESFLRISYESGDYWSVRDTDGTVYRFGYNTDSKIAAIGKGATREWCLDRVTDTHGNYMELKYDEDTTNGDAYLQEIVYVKGNGQSGQRKVELVLEDRTDKIIDYSSGAKMVMDKRLKEIRVKVGSSLVRKYLLSYSISPNSSRSLLASLQMVGSDGSSKLPPIEFTYYENQAGFGSKEYVSRNQNLNFFRYAHVGLAEVNGDGIVDIVFIMGGKFNYALGDHDKGWQAPVAAQSGPPTNEWDFGDMSGWTKLVDVNGDGLTDMIHMGWQYALCNGTGWDNPVTMSNNRPAWDWDHEDCVFIDINGDGFVDSLYGRSGWEYALNNGNDGWEDSVNVPNSPTFNISSWGICVRFVDVNADGLVDLLIDSPSKVRFGNGYGWAEEETVSSIHYWDLKSPHIRFVDINGDGFIDILHGYYDKCAFGNGHGWNDPVDMTIGFRTDDPSIIIADIDGDNIIDMYSTDLGSSQFHYRPGIAQNPKVDLLKGITTSYGGTISFAYKSSNWFDNTGSDARSDLPFNATVADTVTLNDGINSDNTISYSYSGGFYNWEEREFRGFSEVRETDPTGAYTITYFHQDDAKKGKIDYTEAKDSSGSLYLKALNQYQSDSQAPYFAPLIQKDEYTYDGNSSHKQRRTTYSYDDYGNITRASYFGDLSASGDEKTITRSFVPNTSLWILKLAARERIYDNSSGSGSWVAETLNRYDGKGTWNSSPTKGDLTMARRYSSTKGAYVETKYAYDTYGNQTSQTDARGNTTSTSYDTTYHTYPVQIVNPKGHTENRSYYQPGESGGIFGMLKSVADPNGNVTTYNYDSL